MGSGFFSCREKRKRQKFLTWVTMSQKNDNFFRSNLATVKRGIKVKKANVQSFFTFVQEQCPWFPGEGSVNLDTWEKVGKQLKTYYTLHGPEKVPTDTFSLWNIIRDALDPAHESEKVHVKEESKDEEAILSYQQLRATLAAMDTDHHTENRDEKKDQLSLKMRKI